MPDRLRCSALDLAASSGVAFGAWGEAPRAHTWKLGQGGAKSRGERGLELMRFLHAHCDDYRPELVFIEEPLSARILAEIGATLDTSIALPGYVVIAETVLASRGIESRLLKRQEVLKHFTGRAIYPKGVYGKDGAKKACLARCRQLGWAPDGDDEADAMAAWDLGTSQTRPSAQLLADRPRFR